MIFIFLLIFGNTDSVSAVEYDNDVPDCEEMGYNTDLNSCPASKVSFPSHCPYDYNKVKCWKSNCQGYPFSKDEVDDNFDTESCFAGIENGEEIYYYRYAGCNGKDGINYRYDNGECISRCDTAKYPFDSHPGSLAGSVENCYDDTMHYGYTACNEGFGKLVNGSYVPENGRCDMLICDIMAYPFFEKPDEKRGAIEACAGGSNLYYRYVECNDGYEKPYATASNCVKRFALEDKNFNEVKIGDYLTYKGTPIGTFVHIPEEGDGRYLIMSHSNDINMQISTITADIPGLTGIVGAANVLSDKDGKSNTYYLVNDPNDTHPMAEYAYGYYPQVCEESSECGATVWYAPACLEYWYAYLNKYVLYSSFPTSYRMTSNDYMCSRHYSWGGIILLGFTSGMFWSNMRYATYPSRPMMAIGEL